MRGLLFWGQMRNSSSSDSSAEAERKKQIDKLQQEFDAFRHQAAVRQAELEEKIRQLEQQGELVCVGLFVLWSNCSFLAVSPPNQPASSQIEVKGPRFLDDYQLASSALLRGSDNWPDSCLALARKYPEWKEEYENELQTVASSEHAKVLKRLLQVVNDGIGKDERLLSGALAFTMCFCRHGKLALELSRLDVC
ncbi:MAG: hypothetical protein IPG21_18780 [Saprospiraceae bacterium]|nr:hypothetical protein [Candidatus Vicinibacter affinis]